MAIRIELLTGQHDRTTFECGEPSLNEWLARMALQQQDKNYARTRVIVEEMRISRHAGQGFHRMPVQHFT